MDEIIVISDDENEYSLTLNDSSVILEDFGPAVSEQQCRNEEIVDEESGLSVTYSKRGDVLPHARYDCAVHPFSFSDNHMCTPMENNMTFCEQCYCYICGKLASECLSWITPSICHCNAHKRSAYWKMEREKASLGILFEFHFDLLEIDADLQEAGCILHRFEDNLNKEYTKFLLGIKATIHSHGTCKCSCHTKRKKNSSCTLCSSGHMEIISYDYSGVHDLAYKLVCEAEERKPKVAAVLLLGIAKQIMLHKQPMAYVTAQL